MTASPSDLSALYEELRRAADAMFRREPRNHTLQPTALVHEAWLRLSAHDQHLDAGQFRRIAVRVMRRLLVDHARRRRAHKRDSSLLVALDPDQPASTSDVVDVLALDEALALLAASDARAARIAELRIFAGLTLQETADSVGLSVSQTKRITDEATTRLRRFMDHV
ncbi:MAG: ECF-type sigma factor [Planctomycetota bacterium]